MTVPADTLDSEIKKEIHGFKDQADPSLAKTNEIKAMIKGLPTIIEYKTFLFFAVAYLLA